VVCWLPYKLGGGIYSKSLNTGSNPVLTTMSRRYSESSNQDFKNDSAECLRREWDIVGTKESDTPPPSSVDCFQEGCLTGFWNSRKNRNNYSPIISRWGNGQVAELDRRYPIFGGEVK